MINIMKNVSKILLRRKSFLITTFVLPIVLIFAFTALYSSNSSFGVAILNEDEGNLGAVVKERISEMNGFKVTEINKDENYKEAMIFNKYNMVVKINKDFTENLLEGKKSEIKYSAITENEGTVTVNMVLENQVKALELLCNNIDVEKEDIDEVIENFKDSKPDYEVINVKERKPNILNSLGIIFYMIFISAGLSCGFLLEDERERTKDRNIMGNIGEKEYYGGHCLIYFLLSAVPAIEYYFVGKLFGYEFGFDNTIMLLVLLLIGVLLSVVFNIMLSSLIKNKTIYGMVSATLILPVFMLSGSFWEFDMMSEGLQKVGNMLPPRWIFMAIEKLQAGEGVQSTFPTIGGLLLVIVLLFLLAIFFTRSKIILVKDNK